MIKLFLKVFIGIFILTIIATSFTSKNELKDSGSLELTDNIQSKPMTIKLPLDETSFIAAVSLGRESFNTANTDLKKGASRPMRAKYICDLGINKKVIGWVGKIAKLDTNSDGKGVLSIEIAKNTLFSTWNNDVSDIGSNTLIDPDSDLYSSIFNMKIGDMVSFSGYLFPKNTDCFQEISLTLSGSMNAPAYLFKFTSVSKL